MIIKVAVLLVTAGAQKKNASPNNVTRRRAIRVNEAGGTYVALDAPDPLGVALIAEREPVHVVAQLADRLIDLAALGGRLVGERPQGADVRLGELQLAVGVLLLVQLARHVERAVQLRDLALHLGERRLEPVERLLPVGRLRHLVSRRRRRRGVLHLAHLAPSRNGISFE